MRRLPPRPWARGGGDDTAPIEPPDRIVHHRAMKDPEIDATGRQAIETIEPPVIDQRPGIDRRDRGGDVPRQLRGFNVAVRKNGEEALDSSVPAIGEVVADESEGLVADSAQR